MSVRLIRLTRPYGPLFTGETGGWPEPKASELLSAKPPYGVEVDADGNEINAPLQSLVPPSGEDEEWKFDARTDPFVTDGVSKQASQALHKAALHSVADVRQYLASGLDVNEIEGVSDAQAEKIKSLYGAVPDSTDE